MLRDTITAFRAIRSYIVLYNVSYYSLQEAEKKVDRRSYNCLISMVFCAFALEGFLNHLGSIFLKDWNDIEKSMNKDDKLECVCNKTNYQIDKNLKPFCYFNTIFDFRDEIVHAKTEVLSSKKVKIKKGKSVTDLPKAKWEKMVNLTKCRVFFKNTESMITILYKQAGLSGDPFDSPSIAIIQRRME